jgi:hypothetical protein
MIYEKLSHLIFENSLGLENHRFRVIPKKIGALKKLPIPGI